MVMTSVDTHAPITDLIYIDVPKVQFGQHIQFKPPKSPFLKTLEQSTVRKEEPTRSSKPIVYDRDWLLQYVT